VNVLALDLGTKTGWALSEGGRIESGVQTFDVKRGESPGMRFLRFNRWLDETHAVYHRAALALGKESGRLDLIVYEQTHNRGGAATEVAAGFATRVQEFCARLSIEHAAVHSATLKKFTTGSGRGDKAGMFAAALAHGWITGQPDDNEVDAVCLLHYALAELLPKAADTPISGASDGARRADER